MKINAKAIDDITSAFAFALACSSSPANLQGYESQIESRPMQSHGPGWSKTR